MSLERIPTCICGYPLMRHVRKGEERTLKVAHMREMQREVLVAVLPDVSNLGSLLDDKIRHAEGLAASC